MIRGLFTAYTGMLNQQKRLDVITNNLANANTTGYKKEGVTSQSFEDVLTYKIKDSSEKADSSIGKMSLGVKVGQVYTDYTQGNLKETGNRLDFALEGKGFFAIGALDAEGNQSVKYTRDGSFTINKDGYLVTMEGDYVLDPGGSPIMLPTGNTAKFDVDDSGVFVMDNTQIAQLGIVDFEDYNKLTKFGSNLYEAKEGAGIKDATALVHQTCLETSNINVVNEMVQMIALTRAYETNQKMIQTVDTMTDKAVNTVGKL